MIYAYKYVICILNIDVCMLVYFTMILGILVINLHIYTYFIPPIYNR